MTPSKHEIQVATNMLRAEARNWNEVAEELNHLVETAGELKMGRLEAGIFQLLVAPANNASTILVKRCKEGATESRKIGATIRKIADLYDAEESKNVHAIKKIY